MTNNGPPVVVTLVDVATTELQQRAILSSQNENQQSPPIIETNRTETSNQTINQKELSETDKIPTEQQPAAVLTENSTVEEEIPSFSEWAQKRLEEAEKQKEPQNTSTHNNPTSNGGKNSGSGAKLRWKNYASPDCGAKVVASNPEAISASAILSPSRDEYKLNTCTSRIWFIVELCEAIQAKKIDFANFELFSSSPKDFTVSVGDRFPTREWTNVGQFTAKDERDIQSFDLNPQLFGKYVKVEVKSHYGSEHYCPISLFRVYGTSEFEVLQKEDVHPDRLGDDDDDDDGDDESLDLIKGDSSKNLFSSATDAVISMVKKAAEVLANKKNSTNLNETETVKEDSIGSSSSVSCCCSPSHLVVCDNCSDALFGDVYQLLSCHSSQIRNLVEIPLIKHLLMNSNVCQHFGFDFNKCSNTTPNLNNTIESFFSPKFLGAMCNYLAVSQKKVVYNISNQYLNDTKEKTPDEIVNIETSEPKILITEPLKTNTLTLEVSETGSKYTCSTDVNYISQIKPTKTMSAEQNLKEFSTETNQPSELVTDEIKLVPEITISDASSSVLSNNSLPEEEQPEINVEHEVVTESSENLDDHLENFISELNGDTAGQNVQATQSTPQAQKESVFLRLVNRIKALERNMSLSGQYLEELSKRYKKQVEEMQKMLDKTISTMTEEMKKKDEHNKQLEENLSALTAAVDTLIAERNSWSSTISCIFFTTLFILFIYSFFLKRNSRPQTTNDENSKIQVKRRKSIDVVSHNCPEKKRRRPSDQALKIVRSAMVEDVINQRERRKKKKKLHQLKRSASITNLSAEQMTADIKPSDSNQFWSKMDTDWVEGEAKHIEEIPFVLEESEHSTLEPLSGFPDGVKIKAPLYMKTAENLRVLRVNGNAYKKSVSADETHKRDEINGSLDFSSGSSTPKKEKKTLKKIFRKVF